MRDTLMVADSRISPRVQTTPAHEYAEIFPLNEGERLWELGKRILANGLREPIVLHEGKILDGRRRELACIKEGIKPSYRQFGDRKSDGNDPLEFVIDVNLHRRHLGDGDRKLAAARYATAKGGGDRSSTMVSPPSQNATVEKNGVSPTRAQAAAKFEVSKDDVDRAKTVLANGTPKLQAAVADDTVTVSDAAKVAKHPAKVQDKAVDDVKTGKAKTATQAAKQREPGDEPEVIDHFKKSVPEDLHAIFDTVPEFRSAMAVIAKCRKAVEEIAKGKGKRWLEGQETDRLLAQAHANLRFAMPYTECVKCRRKVQKDCKHCRGGGWLNETTFKAAASDADKAWLENRK